MEQRRLPLRPRCRQPRSRPTKSWPRLDPSWTGPVDSPPRGARWLHDSRRSRLPVRPQPAGTVLRRGIRRAKRPGHDVASRAIGREHRLDPAGTNAAQRLRDNHRVAAEGRHLRLLAAVDGQPARVAGTQLVHTHFGRLRPAPPGRRPARPHRPLRTTRRHGQRRRCRADVSPRTVHADDARPHPAGSVRDGRECVLERGNVGNRDRPTPLQRWTPRQSLDVAGRSRHPQFDPGTQRAGPQDDVRDRPGLDRDHPGAGRDPPVQRDR